MLYIITQVVLLAMYRLRLYEPEVSSDVSGKGTVSYHCVMLSGNKYKLVTNIYSDCFVV